MNLDRIIFTWGVGSYGWGVVGINFMLHWPGVALTAATDPQAALPEGDPRAEILAEQLAHSHEWQANPVFMKYPLFVALGNGLGSLYTQQGIPQIAFPVFEDVDVVRPQVTNLRQYACVITASRWNHDVLAEMGISSRMVHQGYDPALFNPGIRRERADGRFRIFSGGKAEWRKGQDLVLEGFRIFAEKHDDAVLHAAWASPWPLLANGFSKSRLGAPPGAEIGFPDFRAWALEAGIKPHQFEIVRATPNHLMPQVLADMDCALFASRIEGGTNIAAMECMGCGIPTILSWTTGQRDLPATLWATEPDEIAAALERVYCCHRTFTGEITAFAWPARIAELVEVLKDV